MNSRLKLERINNDIKELNNDYFAVKCNDDFFHQYLSMFDDESANKELSDNLNKLATFLKRKIQNICKHEWVTDDVDIDPDTSKRICYCRKCEVTKKR